MRRFGIGCRFTVRLPLVAARVDRSVPHRVRGTIRRQFFLSICLILCPTACAQSIFTIAGGGTADGRPATAAGLYSPNGAAVDSAGNLYIANTYSHRIRRVAAGSGITTTVAGDGSRGFTGDGGAATAAGDSLFGASTSHLHNGITTEIHARTFPYTLRGVRYLFKPFG